MSYTLETEVPTADEGAKAYQELPSVTRTVFAQLEALSPDWDRFRRTLQGELETRQWQDAVTLMTSLSTPSAATALARRRHDILQAKGDLTFGIVGGASIGKRYMPICEERLLSNAQVVVSMLQQYLANNYRDGVLSKDGHERRLKVGLHAPFEEFEHSEKFDRVFVDGTCFLPLGIDQRLVLPIFRHGAVVVLTRKNSDHASVLLTTSTLSEEQLKTAKKDGFTGHTHATIMYGTDALPTDMLQAQLQSQLLKDSGTLHDVKIPFSKFALALDIDNSEGVADSHDGSPEWYAAAI